MPPTDTPDDCPIHDLAAADPAATVQLYDDHGRHLGPSSAERACEGHHLGAALDRYIAERMPAAIELADTPSSA